jgi:hypothetical protein
MSSDCENRSEALSRLKESKEEYKHDQGKNLTGHLWKMHQVRLGEPDSSSAAAITTTAWPCG